MIMGSLRRTTQRQYHCYIVQFINFCNSKFDQVTEFTVINFLQVLYDRGLGYSTINTASSAVKTFLEHMQVDIGSVHNLVRFKKGVFNSRPSLPKHVQTWDPQIVLDYLATYDGVVNQMFLARKCAVLLALSSYQRVSTLHSLKVSDLSFYDDRVVMVFPGLLKQSRPGFHLSGLELPVYKTNEKICVVSCLRQYLQLTAPFRQDNADLSAVFITCNKPYRCASKDTIARWIKSIIHEAGVPVEFSAHSTRSASTSSDVAKGVDVSKILAKAGWSSSSVFHKFYNKPVHR